MTPNPSTSPRRRARSRSRIVRSLVFPFKSSTACDQMSDRVLELIRSLSSLLTLTL
jgi:hypothetical protein